MRINEWLARNRDEFKGPRDFPIASNIRDKFLTPLDKEFEKYGVERTELILYAISLAAKSRKSGQSLLRKSRDKHTRSRGEDLTNKMIFNITNQDPEKLEFLAAVMIDLFGPDSIRDYKDMFAKLQELAEEGLEILYEKFTEEYATSPSQFIDKILDGTLI